ncbi:hypothetical protein NDU88_004874 [Pleurodeles waltl]|uniref:Uncharacterized protein n=1 Tax=Pleurodeles waltl TaxID=8319 RepID=A0AAV7MWP0_PLEWA|nr:hypothetical protein NDU88_004874 [Pleurodeles waltl]
MTALVEERHALPCFSYVTVLKNARITASPVCVPRFVVARGSGRVDWPGTTASVHRRWQKGDEDSWGRGNMQGARAELRTA